MTVTQCKMARAGLGWSAADLAERAGLARETVARFEAGGKLSDASIEALRKVMEEAGRGGAVRGLGFADQLAPLANKSLCLGSRDAGLVGKLLRVGDLVVDLVAIEIFCFRLVAAVQFVDRRCRPISQPLEMLALVFCGLAGFWLEWRPGS